MPAQIAFKALSFGALVARRPFNSCLSLCPKFSARSIQMETTQNNISGKNGSRGALIVLEGLDRSGKSSQCSRLLSFLERLGYPADLWRFPDRNTSVGQMISTYLSNKSQLDDHTIHLLFSANRWEKRSLMEAKLKAGITLIVDRYSYSGVAFSSAKGLDVDWCKKAAQRGGYGGERYEQLDFQKKVAQCYEVLSDSSWKIIDACQPIEDVEKELQEIVLDHVKKCQNGKPFSHLWLS
ncbi:thymidylate kinase isoform X3 [Carica papaya]|uniref:thymidylate kinase isoform X3 n=1 Tax=Carica papaya TaxID=3649 RepID=UPI000B8C7583|nr:thymidylate kinase isoform X3 [Carica papaya]